MGVESSPPIPLLIGFKELFARTSLVSQLRFLGGVHGNSPPKIQVFFIDSKFLFLFDYKWIIFCPCLRPEHDILAHKKKIMAVFLSGGERRHSPDFTNGREDVARSHRECPVLFPPEDHEGAVGATFFGAVFSNDVHGRSEEDEFVCRIQKNSSSRGMGVSVLVQGKITDQEIASCRRVVSSEYLTSQDSDPSHG